MAHMRPPWRWLMLACAMVCTAHADFARDLAHIHAEAVGGRERVQALRGLKASGVTRSGEGIETRFRLWAERPARIRIEITLGERTIVQAWDGEGEPWTADSRTQGVSWMAGDIAEAFKAEAEFDDPLLAGPGRQVALDYGGVVDLEGEKRIKIMVTQNFTEVSFVYLDPASYLIVRRDTVRRMRGREAILRTDYSDFRPVEGVLLPHRLVVTNAGKRLRETVIARMEANPAVPAGLFKVPASAAAKP